MPITKTYTLYTFDELSDRAKEKARDWYRSSDVGNDNMMSESFAQTLSYYGFPEGSMKIYYSLAYCQGDGVSFKGRIDFDALLATTESELEIARTDGNLVVIRDLIKQARAIDMDLSGKVESNGDFHECSMDIELDCYYANDEVISPRDQIAEKLQEALEEFVMDLSLQLKKDGYSDLDYRFSDEVVDETILVSEFTFCEDGKREN